MPKDQGGFLQVAVSAAPTPEAKSPTSPRVGAPDTAQRLLRSNLGLPAKTGRGARMDMRRPRLLWRYSPAQVWDSALEGSPEMYLG